MKKYAHMVENLNFLEKIRINDTFEIQIIKEQLNQFALNIASLNSSLLINEEDENILKDHILSLNDLSFD